MLVNTKRTVVAFAAAVFAAVSTGAWAQADAARDFPTKPVRFISPFTPGAGTDTTARALAAHLSTIHNQQYVVDNRTGAAGSIGVELTAGAPPDGYTICLISASHSVNSGTNSKLSYDLGRDLQGISQATSLFYAVYINPKVPAKSIQELITYARANPGKLNFSSSGTGGLQHFAGEMFNHLAKVQMTHVAYKGTAAGVIANLSGDVQVGFGALFGVRSHWQAGRLRVLAITASKRSPAVPDVPTVAESGFAGFDDYTWFSVFAPAGIPSAIVNQVNRDFTQALQSPASKTRLAALSLEFTPNTPTEFAARLKAEVAKYAQIVKQSGARVD